MTALLGGRVDVSGVVIGAQILVSGVWIMQVPDDDQDGATESPNRYPACRRRRRLAVGDKRCMSVSSSDPIVLSDAQRQVLLARARETRGSIATWCVPGLCLSALTARQIGRASCRERE